MSLLRTSSRGLFVWLGRWLHWDMYIVSFEQDNFSSTTPWLFSKSGMGSGWFSFRLRLLLSSQSWKVNSISGQIRGNTPSLSWTSSTFNNEDFVSCLNVRPLWWISGSVYSFSKFSSIFVTCLNLIFVLLLLIIILFLIFPNLSSWAFLSRVCLHFTYSINIPAPCFFLPAA